MDDDDSVTKALLDALSAAYLGNQVVYDGALAVGSYVAQLKESNTVNDEEGIDLSEVPVCVRCGLEMANRTEHEAWHQQQQRAILDLQAKVDSLEQMIKNQWVDIQRHPQGSPQTYAKARPNYITRDEIRKYGIGQK